MSDGNPFGDGLPYRRLWELYLENAPRLTGQNPTDSLPPIAGPDPLSGLPEAIRWATNPMGELPTAIGRVPRDRPTPRGDFAPSGPAKPYGGEEMFGRGTMFDNPNPNMNPMSYGEEFGNAEVSAANPGAFKDRSFDPNRLVEAIAARNRADVVGPAQSPGVDHIPGALSPTYPQAQSPGVDHVPGVLSDPNMNAQPRPIEDPNEAQQILDNISSPVSIPRPEERQAQGMDMSMAGIMDLLGRMPQREDHQLDMNWWQKLLLGGAGAAAGYASDDPMTGYNLVTSILDRPYDQAYGDWSNELQSAVMGEQLEQSQAGINNQLLIALMEQAQRQRTDDVALQGHQYDFMADVLGTNQRDRYGKNYLKSFDRRTDAMGRVGDRGPNLGEIFQLRDYLTGGPRDPATNPEIDAMLRVLGSVYEDTGIETNEATGIPEYVGPQGWPWQTPEKTPQMLGVEDRLMEMIQGHEPGRHPMIDQLIQQYFMR